jgi:hypothetical protein
MMVSYSEEHRIQLGKPGNDPGRLEDKKSNIDALTFLSKKSYFNEKTIFTIFKDSDPAADYYRYDYAGRNGRRYFICRYRELECNCVA